MFPLGDGEVFCEHIFRVFDDDGNNSLEFRVGFGFIILLFHCSEFELLAQDSYILFCIPGVFDGVRRHTMC